jgi:hypothetical protein
MKILLRKQHQLNDFFLSFHLHHELIVRINVFQFPLTIPLLDGLQLHQQGNQTLL